MCKTAKTLRSRKSCSVLEHSLSFRSLYLFTHCSAEVAAARTLSLVSECYQGSYSLSSIYETKTSEYHRCTEPNGLHSRVS